MPESKPSKFDLAVIMPVRNEEKYVGQTLEQLYLQDFPMDRLEVVVADGGSTDRTREIVESYKTRFGALRLLDNPVRRPSSGRNIGIRNSTAPRIVVIDGHVYIPSKTLLRDVVETFDRTGADCLCRPQPLTPPDLNDLQTAIALCRGSALGHKPGSEIYADYEGEVDPTSSGAMWTRATFDRVGLFDENFDAGEDIELNFRVHRAKLKAWLNPALRVYYYPRATLPALWRQMVRYGLGRFRMSRKHGLWAPTHWLAAAGVVLCIVLFVLGFLSLAVMKLFQIVAALYLLTVIFYSLSLALRHRNLNCLLYGPLIFPTIHFGLGVGFLKGVIESYSPPPAREAGPPQ
ncbi:MAG TPA: glycosyltransferase family 2 protein [candidate division Zixibacteria bacterium]|nr:glycosyltransferase family 2 protein [candidate division Zixibacteria bacterium]MDD4916841.1 glycosyltransferase family 2 protein [candidate division Zixibacteria bacterium]MDM7973563.1 glycosyltransferase family 2 protein [candidate division Zixibacteria bacterium]HOD65157.1 glycosyltransferase family 2 protein [candidate division Zixibacteria bacterium]HOZ08132.1 glycosyltransferase family 2 protein [candidate division Zixibacteria bacterium]